MKSVRNAFDLTGKVAVITGGAGLLGTKHAEAIAEMGGTPVLWDLEGARGKEIAEEISSVFGVKTHAVSCDITRPEQVSEALSKTIDLSGPVDILINNAAHNPKVESGLTSSNWCRLENFPMEMWERDIGVGLTGAFLCSQIVGTYMAQRGSGVIVNIASDLALIGPDQRIYREPGVDDAAQPVKPVTYPVVKAGLLGLTRYLATYWADRGIRVNSISPGGIYAGQDTAFVRRLSQLIPLGRMADKDEYKAAIAFLVSDASSYMTGANLIIDGGRTCW